MRSEDTAGRLARLAVLQDPVRLRLYQHIAAEREPVGRDAAAAAVGVSRRLAAFHLDKLAEAGLLTVSYRRLTERRGPGAGRPAKLYARAPDEVTVTVPPRDYELAARLFAATVAALGRPAADTMAGVARDTGRTLAAPFAAEAAGPGAGPRCLEALLAAVGYEPYHSDGTTRLRNCPFHRVAEDHRQLVCTANLHLLRGITEELAPEMDASLDPLPGECCVRLQPGR
ncbi:MAG TPA: helix-turn-helix domain-containing protein [Geodermatophilus sp.]|nr:helix-turn-helix domain-containing protein [Geodermatophilus sp.]